MTDIIGGGDNHKDVPEAKPEQPKAIVLTITYGANGSLNVSGPGNGELFDEPLCWWLLEKAKRHIERSNALKSQSNIVVPKPRIKDIFRRH